MNEFYITPVEKPKTPKVLNSQEPIFPSVPSIPAPTNLKISGIDKAKLAWVGSPGCDFYRVKRSEAGVFQTLIELKSCVFVDTTVTSGNTYSYVILAVIDSRESRPSNKATITIH